MLNISNSKLRICHNFLAAERIQIPISIGVLHAIVKPLDNTYHWEPTFSPLQRGIPNSGASGIFPVAMVLRNWTVEHNVATAFPWCTLDDLAEKVDGYIC